MTFRFQVLLQLHRRDRDEASLAVGQASEAIAKIEAELQRLDEERIELSVQRKQDPSSGAIDVDKVLSMQRFDTQLEFDRNGLLATREKLVEEQQRRLDLLHAAETEVKKLEKLHQVSREREHKERQRHEQLEIDERSIKSLLQRRILQRRSQS